MVDTSVWSLAFRLDGERLRLPPGATVVLPIDPASDPLLQARRP